MTIECGQFPEYRFGEWNSAYTTITFKSLREYLEELEEEENE